MKTKTLAIAILLIITSLIFVPLPKAEPWGNNIIGVYPINDHVTIGDKFAVPINVTVVWYMDTVAVLNFTFLPAGKCNFSNSTKGDIWDTPVQYFHPQDNNAFTGVYNATGNATQFTMAGNPAVNDTNKSLATVYMDAIDVGICYINVSNYETLRTGLDNGTDAENATVYIHPDHPSSFSIEDGSTYDNLTWTRGTGEDKALIRYSTSTYPEAISDGTLLYNGSLEYYNFSKDIEQDYYYSIWGWNETYSWYSLGYNNLSSDSVASLPSGFTATTNNRTSISLNWTSAYTSTLTLRPNAPGSATEWDTNDNTNWEAVDEVSADGGTTRNRVDTNGARDSYNITNHTTETGAITQVEVFSRLMDDGSGMTCRITIFDQTYRTYENNTAFSPSDGTYTTYSHVWSQNPWTGSAWTWDEIDGLEIGVEYVSNEDDRIYITQTYAEVTYADPPQSYIERNTATTWDIFSGSEVYNNTGTSFTDDSLWPNTHYYYQLWSFVDGKYSETNISADNTTDSNSVIVFSSEDPNNGTSGVDINYADVDITINDPEGDSFNWSITGEYISTGSNNDDSNGTFSANLNTPLPYNTNIIWYVNSTDVYSNTNASYNFTTREQYTPSAPAGFSATTYNRTVINLSWTPQTGNNTLIEYNTFEGWERGSGNVLDNGTNSTYDHTGLTEGTQYFYQIWSFNTTDGTYSTANSSANDTTTANQAPAQAGEVPYDDSGQQELTQSPVNVTITDPEGDSLSWNIDSSTGDTDSGTDGNGSISLALTTPHDYDEEVVWIVNVTDGTDWTNATYNFTVRSKYTPSAPPTGFTATNISSSRIDLAWTKNGVNNTVIEFNTTADWPLGAGTEIYNGSLEVYSHTSLSKDTTYYYQAWAYNTTDNAFSTANATANNKTQANAEPNQASTFYPDNVTWIEFTNGEKVNITVSDPDGDALDVTFYWSNNGTEIGTNLSVPNGTVATYNIPFSVVNYTNYSWHANITDGSDNKTTPTKWFKVEAFDYDIDRDAKCYPSDLSLLVTYYTDMGTPHWIRSDISRDGTVGAADLSILVTNYMTENLDVP